MENFPVCNPENFPVINPESAVTNELIGLKEKHINKLLQGMHNCQQLGVYCDTVIRCRDGYVQGIVSLKMHTVIPLINAPCAELSMTGHSQLSAAFYRMKMGLFFAKIWPKM